MFKLMFISFTIVVCSTANTQTFEFGYSFGSNGTIARTIKTDNPTWGYSNPIYPSTWTNHFFLGVGRNKVNLFLGFDSGGLGISYRLKNVYTDKFPWKESSNNNSQAIAANTAIQKSTSRSNTNLLKFSTIVKVIFFEGQKYQHKYILGAGFLKTRINTPLRNTGSGTISDSLGILSHVFVIDKYAYLRKTNCYLIFGYEFSLPLNKQFTFNSSFIYNQGIFKMVKWHSYRLYTESLSNYTEYDEQWTFTRLSYYSLQIGLSCKLGLRKSSIKNF